MAVAKGTVFTFKLEFVDSITGCLVVKRIPDLAPGVAGARVYHGHGLQSVFGARTVGSSVFSDVLEALALKGYQLHFEGQNVGIEDHLDGSSKNFYSKNGAADDEKLMCDREI